MRVIAFDPGSKKLGYAAVESVGQRYSVLEYGTLDLPRDMPDAESISAAFDKARSLLDQHKPGAVAIESLFFNVNQKTAFKVAETRGVLLLAAAQVGIPVSSYTPPAIKKAVCGYGAADKSQVQAMVRTLLQLKEVPQDDSADALAVAICHLNSASLMARAQAATAK